MQPDPSGMWDKIIGQFGQTFGLSRYTGNSVMIDDRSFGVGAEYQPPDADYRWHGLRRGGTAKHRWVSFQWTIEGEGILRVGKREHAQRAGQALLVPVPSDHEYRISPTGTGWKFFYVMVTIPWIVDRLGAITKDLDYTFPIEPSSRLALETLNTIHQSYSGIFEDRYETEKMIANWAIEVQRHLHHLQHPEDDREAMLAKALAFYERNKSRSFGVEDFAKHLGMTRVAASLHFQKITGRTPAAHFMELRLKDAITLLGQGLKLQHVASDTGFADANHFCKVFRRVYHVSPGQYRRMMGIQRQD
jgi:AraC-like DNA-binding protein/mannose-6-phosphate isomerase-like protein (cupin superfamily)